MPQHDLLNLSLIISDFAKCAQLLTLLNFTCLYIKSVGTVTVCSENAVSGMKNYRYI